MRDFVRDLKERKKKVLVFSAAKGGRAININGFAQAFGFKGNPVPLLLKEAQSEGLIIVIDSLDSALRFPNGSDGYWEIIATLQNSKSNIKIIVAIRSGELDAELSHREVQSYKKIDCAFFNKEELKEYCDSRNIDINSMSQALIELLKRPILADIYAKLKKNNIEFSENDLNYTKLLSTYFSEHIEKPNSKNTTALKVLTKNILDKKVPYCSD